MDLLDYILIALAALAIGALGLMVLFSRRKYHALASEQSDQIAVLTQELTTLTHRLDRAEEAERSGDDAVLITEVGSDPPEPTISNRLVLSATVGEPLVKSLAFAHGLRVALSPESRNRIRFEMKRETRRARKQRRQDMKTAYRQMRQGDLGQGDLPESRTA